VFLILPPALVDRFSGIVAFLCELVAEQGVRQWHDGRLTILIYNRIQRVARRFLARATVPPRAGEDRPRARHTRAAPRPRPWGTETEGGTVGAIALGAAERQLPTGRAWLLKLMRPTDSVRSQLMALLSEPEVAALLLARPHLARLLRPLCHALSIPPMPGLAPPRRRLPPLDLADHDAAGADPADAPGGAIGGPTGTAPAAPPPRRRRFLFRRNEDLLFRLRMGTPLPAC